MAEIQENVYACKQSIKIRRQKKKGCKEREQMSCDCGGVQANDLRHGILDGTWHGKEIPVQFPKINFFFVWFVLFLREGTLPLPKLRSFVCYYGKRIMICIRVCNQQNHGSLQISAEQGGK